MAVEHLDVVRIRDEQVLDGERILNIFYYVIAVFTAGVTLLDLLAEFRDVVTAAQLPLQHVDLNHTLLHVDNLSNGLDEEELVLDSDGTDSAGEALNTFTAAGFSMICETKLTRNGSKRIAGISEGRVQGNTYIAGVGEDTAYADALAEVLQLTGTPSGIADAYPVVVGRDEFGQLVLANWNTVVAGAVKTNITSQTSRKQII